MTKEERLRETVQALDVLLPDVLALLPLLKGLAMFGEFGDLRFNGEPITDALASAVGTLTELEEVMAPQVYRETEPA